MHAFKHAYVHVTYTHPHTHMRTCMLAYIVKYKRCTEVYTQAHDLFVLRLYVYGLICHSAFVHIHIYIYIYVYIYIYMYGPPPPHVPMSASGLRGLLGLGGDFEGFASRSCFSSPRKKIMRIQSDSNCTQLNTPRIQDSRFKIARCPGELCLAR